MPPRTPRAIGSRDARVEGRGRASSARPSVAIISPALAAANNGNWQTARRWAAFLAAGFRTEIRTDWSPDDGFDGDPARPPDAMIALHARRSAGAIERFAATGRPLALVLTSTDLYRDIREDASARRSLELADRLVCLQERGPDELAPALRARAEVIPQSARALAGAPPRARSFDLLLVGHLRPEKDPLTAARALARLPDPRLRLVHVGDARDAVCGAAFAAAAEADPRIERRGPLPHAATRRLIRRGRLLVLPSLMEGGANVLIEAVTSGVPVLGSRIPGSVGLLGEDYEGWFPVGDDAALAALIARCTAEPAFVERLRAQCAARAPRFAPERERSAVRALAHNLVDGTFRRSP
ncbi:MAG TPA: selenoneine biosynthesis selenosugar synthase SenB [Burkholderiaceae bacterium]|nr:selenoneine biosynthesis selenosugar synthase SenB [Burkholderiaceae bacterium]